MSRRPLHKHSVNVLTDTPKAHSSKITTPPRSVHLKRNHSVLETPVRPDHSTSHQNHAFSMNNVLLSPAFSSPQPPQPPIFDHHSSSSSLATSESSHSAHLAPPPPPFATGFSTSRTTNAETVFGSSFGSVFGEPTATQGDLSAQTDLSAAVPAKKKPRPKKPRREASDTCFSIDSHEKPPYSYATLIGMSILSHPAKQLTLSQIYAWISETFKYYRREDVGWQNSIRHNLSLNKAFVKGMKSKDGKGHYWCIKPECEDLFLKAKNNKKSSYHEVMDQLALSRSRAARHSIPSSPTSVSYEEQKKSDEEPSAKRAKTDSQQSNDVPVDSPLRNALLQTPNVRARSAPDKPMLAEKNMTFTSSFSCNSNFELSPAHPMETGPILEPLTPAAVASVVFQQTGSASNMQLPSITLNRVAPPHIPQLQPSLQSITTPRTAGSARTPLTSIKTPLRTLKTPSGSTLVRKLWQSPSYLEEFYHSPFGTGRALLNSYDDDDMLMRAFDSPASSREGRINLLHELKRADEICEKRGDESSSVTTDVDGED